MKTTRAGVSTALGVMALGVLLSGLACGTGDDATPGGPDAAADATNDAATPPLEAGVPVEGDAPLRPVSWQPSDAPLQNPERGFYRYVEIETDRDFDYVREGGDTLIYSYVRLDAYRDSAIATALLERVQAGLDAARAAGLEVVLRFAYNEGPYPDSEPDASLERVLQHIEQLGPLLRANEDVIALVQAGYVGAWGEWHTSTHGLDRDPAARRRIVDALLASLPATRSTQLRYPAHKRTMFGEPLNEAQGLTGEAAARVGHHNDCFLASDSDEGTYPEGERDRWVQYLAADTRFVPMGGETCAVFPALTACSFAPAEMQRLHFSFLNRDYHEDVVRGWSDGGCLAAIERTLGYRFELTSGELPDAARPGGVARVRLGIVNRGWAAPFNPRSVWLVLQGGGERRAVEVPGSDVRRWAPGETSVVDVRLRLPIDLEPGDYTLSLWLPSASVSLRDRADYAIQLANHDLWQAASGDNRLCSLRVDDAAPGTVDEAATALHVLPAP